MPLTPHTRCLSHGQFTGGWLNAWAGAIRTWLQRAHQRRTLAELDNRMLRDIGVTRAQAQREAAKPFWSVGKAQSTHVS